MFFITQTKLKQMFMTNGMGKTNEEVHTSCTYLLTPRPSCGLIAFWLHFWLHPSPSSGAFSSGSFDIFNSIQQASEKTCSASSPSCTCGLSDRSCGSSRRCSPSSVASGWFFSTQPSPRSVTQSGASSGRLPGLFSPPEQLCGHNPVRKMNFREDLTVKPRD